MDLDCIRGGGLRARLLGLRDHAEGNRRRRRRRLGGRRRRPVLRRRNGDRRRQGLQRTGEARVSARARECAL
ncbi:hypothetical protein E8A74_37180 [Polyangium fumosum]|uniref:Uncharacterized protein n=1 Tax=Polyangium fumosum TaxID=889272 RepID=A0A4U1IY16_9BACT|nr:hypothetical protein E8A74_37180 [Polyangium fumosum]